MFEAMHRLIPEKQIRPVIDRVFALADGPAALKHMESGSHFGKVVLKM